ncbi:MULTISPECIES: hypothetical protein [unclassified Mesorhizobium]
MTVLAHSIASDPHGTWRAVFLPEELHLYLEFIGQAPAQIPSTR